MVVVAKRIDVTKMLQIGNFVEDGEKYHEKFLKSHFLTMKNN